MFRCRTGGGIQRLLRITIFLAATLNVTTVSKEVKR
jgi:hypothetical protein